MPDDHRRLPRLRADLRQGALQLARLRRDFGGNSPVVTVTDRRAGDTTNTVLAGDVRSCSAACLLRVATRQSWTKDALRFGTTDMKVAPIWKAELDRTGRSWGFNYQVNGISDEFVSRSGFLPRNGIIRANAFNRLSYYGEPGATLQSVTVFFGPERIWLYDNFALDDAYEGRESVTGMFRLRGGWNLSTNIARNFFTFDPQAYAGLYVVGPDGLQPYLPPDDQLSGLVSVSGTVGTPTFRNFNVSLTVARNQTAVFAEGSEGREWRATGNLTLRPTVSLRAEGACRSCGSIARTTGQHTRGRPSRG